MLFRSVLGAQVRPSPLQRWQSLQVTQHVLQTPSQLKGVAAGQAEQVPRLQVAPVGHLFPQRPQFSTSVEASTQTLPHLVSGSAQRQPPALQTRPEAHSVPQVPQLSSSLPRFRQVPPQLVVPVWQQTPAMQRPSSPQDPSRLPHTPVPGWQALQSPVQAVAQQTLLMQRPDWHSPAETHESPFGFGLATQLPEEHMNPFPQAVVRVSQAPLALQVRVTLELPEQVAPPQVTVPSPLSRRQPPFPSQPLEQASSRHMPVGSAPPTKTLAHSPSCPGTAHERQVPLQAPAQHRPCAQTPVMHSVPAVQMAPLGFFPQSLALQTLPPEHWASLPQLLRHAFPLHPR